MCTWFDGQLVKLIGVPKAYKPLCPAWMVLLPPFFFWQNVSIDLQISHYKGSDFVDLGHLGHCIYALENSPPPKSSESDELSFVFI